MTTKPHRDHLWVLVVIAACCLIEVWASWVTIGSMSGFPRILGRIPTDWILAVTSEAYWGYALYAWLAASPGPKSRRFAMWTAGVVFALSLVGQGASHVVPAGAKPPAVLVVFVTDLPVLVLALIAILIHLRQKDREEAAEAGRVRQEADRAVAENAAADDERAVLRAELETARQALEVAGVRAEEAERATAEAAAKTEALTRKLAGNGTRKRGGNAGRKPARKPAAATAPEDAADVDREALVLKYLAEGHSASKAGVMAGLSDSRGRQIARELAKAAPADPNDG